MTETVLSTSLCNARAFLWAFSVRAQPDEHMVLLQLATYADPDTGDVTANVYDLTYMNLSSERSIRRIITNLIDKGYVFRTRARTGRGGGIALRLALDTEPLSLPLRRAPVTDTLDGAEKSDENGDENGTENGRISERVPILAEFRVNGPINETQNGRISMLPDPPLPPVYPPSLPVEQVNNSETPISSVGFSSPPNGRTEEQLSELVSGDWTDAWTISEKDVSELIRGFRHKLDEDSIRIAVNAFLENERDKARSVCSRTGKRPPAPRSRGLTVRAQAWLDREASWRPHRNGYGRRGPPPVERERDESFLAAVRETEALSAI